MMVVLILAALIAIAGPFALSMFLYERSSRHFSDGVRARLAAEGGVARAISVLRRTEDRAEEEGKQGAPWNTPNYDTEEEFRVYFEFGGRAGKEIRDAGIDFDDPRGVIWSVRVEDEQSKINLISAPPWVVGNLLRSANLAADFKPGQKAIVLDDAEIFYTDDDPRTVDGEVVIGRGRRTERYSYTAVIGDQLQGLTRLTSDDIEPRTRRAGALVYDAAGQRIADAALGGHFRTLFELKRFVSRAEDFERVMPYVTVNSYRDSGTGWAAKTEILGGFGGTTLRVRSVAGFGAGARARFYEDDALRGGMRRIISARQQGQFGRVVLDERIWWGVQDPNATLYVQPEQIHPVNVNTASKAVLISLLAGVGQSADRIGRFEAEAIAGFIHDYVREKRYGGRPLGSHADFRVMLEAARAAKLISWGKLQVLMQEATAKMCYKAFGNFTIEAAGVVNTPAGEESSRYVVRHLISMPVESGGRWTLASQKDFDEQMTRVGSQKVASWPFREPPRRSAEVARYKRGFDARGRDADGYVTLATGSAADVRQGRGIAEHFGAPGGRFSGPRYLTHDGARIGNAALWAAPAGAFTIGNTRQCEPVVMEAWFRLEGGGARRGILSAGGPNRNGVGVVYDQAALAGQPALVVTVADACAGQGDQAKPWLGPAKFLFPAPSLDPYDWYHVAAEAKGTGLGDAHAWLDGVAFRSWDAANAEYRPGTRLRDSLTIDVSDTELIEGTRISVDPVQGGMQFPATNGVIIIDAEVMEYEKFDGSSFENCRRARRFTHLAAHAPDTPVIPYGYSVRLENDLFKGEARIASNLGPNPLTTIPRTTETDASGAEVVKKLEPDETSIPIVNGGDFQESGYAVIEGPRGRPREYIFYGSTARNKKSLEDVERGLSWGTTGVTGRTWDMDGAVRVRQISIACTNMSQDYKVYPEPQYRSGWDIGSNTSYLYACVKDPNSCKVEWIRLEHREDKPDGTTYLLGRRQTSGDWWPRRDLMSWRAQLGTKPLTDHDDVDFIPKGAHVLPVVAVSGPQCGHENTPRYVENPGGGAPAATPDDGEMVTPVEGGRAESDALRITHSSSRAFMERDVNPYRHRFVYRVSLDKPITGSTYRGGGGRLLKFPSGEFLRTAPSKVIAGAAGGAPLGGSIDEVRCYRTSRDDPTARVAMDFSQPPTTSEPVPLNAGDQNIYVMADMAGDGRSIPTQSGSGGTGFQAANRPGIVKIGDELVFYESCTSAGATGGLIPWGEEQRSKDKICPEVNPDETYRMSVSALQGCVRGLLGTRPAAHGAGARAVFLDGIPITRLQSALYAGADTFSIESSQVGEHFPGEGYAVVSAANLRAEAGRGEVIGWTRKSGSTSFTGCEFLRGRYGTNEDGFRQGDFVQLLPFRYWDRYAVDHDGEDLAYFQAAYTARGAHWQSIEWSESGHDGGAATDLISTKVVCRFDGAPEWDLRPTNRPGGLWEFTGGGSRGFRGARGRPFVADSIEVRVYWQYRNRAWDPGSDANDWKRNVRLDNLTVTFGSPLVVRKVDLLDH